MQTRIYQVRRTSDRTDRESILGQSSHHLPIRSSIVRRTSIYVKSVPNTRSRRLNIEQALYGCIYTCLRYRAVHIEAAEDLSTDI